MPLWLTLTRWVGWLGGAVTINAAVFKPECLSPAEFVPARASVYVPSGVVETVFTVSIELLRLTGCGSKEEVAFEGMPVARSVTGPGRFPGKAATPTVNVADVPTGTICVVVPPAGKRNSGPRKSFGAVKFIVYITLLPALTIWVAEGVMLDSVREQHPLNNNVYVPGVTPKV